MILKAANVITIYIIMYVVHTKIDNMSILLAQKTTLKLTKHLSDTYVPFRYLLLLWHYDTYTYVDYHAYDN